MKISQNDEENTSDLIVAKMINRNIKLSEMGFLTKKFKRKYYALQLSEYKT